MLYRIFFTLIVRWVDPEQAHEIAVRLLRTTGRLLPAARVDPRLAVELFGRSYSTPLGVAAGFDKNAVVYGQLLRLGFGHVEIGTVTAQAQPGNPRPRVFRLPRQRALINRMGFPGEGARAVRQRVQRERGGAQHVAFNIGKSKSVELHDAEADYAISASELAPYADFLVVNVSSPNTPGLRDLQAIGPLRGLLRSVRDEIGDLDCPLLVKISPDLADEDVDAIADLAIELGIAGIVCCNTTLSREGLPDADGGYEDGGLSGEPLRERSLAVLRRIRGRAGDRLVLISVGGISDGADVWERLVAGASMVQAYTGFVFGGPLWPRRVNRELRRLLDDSGSESISAVVGSYSDV